MAALQEIEHIVVLMMENRSFDHMFGYLGLPPHGRTEIDGLQHSHAILHEGVEHRPQPAKGSIFSPDPHHDAESIAMHMADGNRGFIAAFARQVKTRPERIINYLSERHLPTYHLLAEEFVVCDRWFSSVPGATWPNRLYALAGTSEGALDNPPLGPSKSLPAYDTKTIFEVLDETGVGWHIYSHNLAFVRVFRKFRMARSGISKFVDHFADDCRRGELAPVVWIDPRFEDVSTGGNDDHPPTDVLKGQELVRKIYEALRSNEELFEKTLLLITYDEHGGFYDHAHPDTLGLHPEDDLPEMRHYGVRVPGLIVSPWVPKRAVCHTVLDHTSILATILRRFAPAAHMGRRVAAAQDVWGELSEPKARTGFPVAPQVMAPGFEEFTGPSDLGRMISALEDEVAPVVPEDVR